MELKEKDMSLRKTQNEIEEKTIKILERYPVSKAAFFGSVLSESFKNTSDIDMLVEFLPNSSGLDFFGLKVDLEDEFNRPVDLITYNALSGAKPGFKNEVERSAYVFYIRTNVQHS
jgi:predicted nucleotidyltransferase